MLRYPASLRATQAQCYVYFGYTWKVFLPIFVAMARHVRLFLSDHRKGLDHVDFDLSDEEEAAFKIFLDAHRRLSNSKPGREGISCKIKLSHKTNNGTSVIAELPDQDTLDILLHRLRPFILQNEPGSFVKVMGIIGRHIHQQDVRNLLKHNHMLYDGRVSQSQFRAMSRDGTVINSERFFQSWLNSHEYHGNHVERKVVSELLEAPLGELPRFLWYWLLLDKLYAIHNAAGIIETTLGIVDEYRFGSMTLSNVKFPSSDSDEYENPLHTHAPEPPQSIHFATGLS